MNQEKQTLDFNHLFRSESGKMVSVLSKIFGFSKIDSIEEVVQETFLSAFQTWKLQGYPENPKAWLYRVAKNKLLNEIHREKIFESKIEQNTSLFPVSYHLESKWEEEIQIYSDSQMRLMFMICNPILPEDSQIALALKIVCGFTVEEIGKVFLSNREAVQKKIMRSKAKLIENKIDLSLDNSVLYLERVPFVLKILYLIFSEGYYSLSSETILRKDLCLEALRLALILFENSKFRSAECSSLISLMCFHSSRFESRVSNTGIFYTLDDQDASKWNTELIQKGYYYLEIASSANYKSDYLLEAMIASLHTKRDSEEKWNALAVLYSDLYKITKNPVVAMNLAYVKSKTCKDIEFQKTVIAELLTYSELQSKHLYHLILAKLLMTLNPLESERHFSICLEKCDNPIEREMIKDAWNGKRSFEMETALAPPAGLEPATQ